MSRPQPFSQAIASGVKRLLPVPQYTRFSIIQPQSFGQLRVFFVAPNILVARLFDLYCPPDFEPTAHRGGTRAQAPPWHGPGCGVTMHKDSTRPLWRLPKRATVIPVGQLGSPAHRERSFADSASASQRSHDRLDAENSDGKIAHGRPGGFVPQNCATGCTCHPTERTALSQETGGEE